MRELIGYYLIVYAITSFAILVFGDNFDCKEKCVAHVYAAVVLALIFIGMYLINEVS